MYTLSYMIVPLLNARDNYLTNARLSIKGNTLTPKDILELGSPGCGLGTYKYMSVRLHWLLTTRAHRWMIRIIAVLYLVCWKDAVNIFLQADEHEDAISEVAEPPFRALHNQCCQSLLRPNDISLSSSLKRFGSLQALGSSAHTCTMWQCHPEMYGARHELLLTVLDHFMILTTGSQAIGIDIELRREGHSAHGFLVFWCPLVCSILSTGHSFKVWNNSDRT